MDAVELDNGLFGIDILGVTHERYQLPFASHGTMDGRQGTQAEMGSLGSLVAVLLKASESGWVLRGSLVMNLTGNPPKKILTDPCSQPRISHFSMSS